MEIKAGATCYKCGKKATKRIIAGCGISLYVCEEHLTTEMMEYNKKHEQSHHDHEQHSVRRSELSREDQASS